MTIISSPREVRRYRALKLLVFAALAIAWIAVFSANLVRTPIKEPLPVRPIVTTTEPIRNDFPLTMTLKSRERTLSPGDYVVEGRGPKGTVANITDGSVVLGTTPVAEDGHWRTRVHLEENGLHTLRADLTRSDVRVGSSVPLTISISDGRVSGETPLRITNLGRMNRLRVGPVTLRGDAQPGDFLKIYIDATVLGRAEVMTNGRWEFKTKVNGRGRRTFTVVDEITEDQFGPLPVIFYGGAKAKSRPNPKPKPKPAPKAKPRQR